MVPGKLPVPGRPTNLDNNGARAYCACSRCGWALFGHFFTSSIISVFFLPLFGERPGITEILSQGAVEPKTTIAV